MSRVYKGDVGTQILLDTGQALAGQTDVRILYEKPNGVKGYWTGSVVESTKISYDTLAGDLDVEGTWKVQTYAVLPSWTGYGDVVEMSVYDHLYKV